MGDPMVPKITIAVRSDAAQGPRRVSPPSNAAAGGVPFPAVARRRFGDRGPLRASLEDTPEVSAPAPRETARHDGSVHATPGCCPVSPLPPVFGAPGRPCRLTARSTGPVRRRAALRARRGLFRWTPGISSPATALCEPLECRALYARHHGVTTGFCLAACAAAALQACLRPVTTGSPHSEVMGRDSSATSCDKGK